MPRNPSGTKLTPSLLGPDPTGSAEQGAPMHPQLPAVPLKSCPVVTLSLTHASLLTEMPILLSSMSQFYLTLHSPLTPPDSKIPEVRQQVGHIAA